MEIINQNPVFPNPVPVNPRKKLLTGLILIAIILITGAFVFYIFGFINVISNPVFPKTTSTPTATPAARKIPSSLATNPDFLILENELGQLDKDLNNVDLVEPKLTLPVIELNLGLGKE